MKAFQKAAALLLVLCVLFTLAVSACAEEEYTYTVRFLAGGQGTINGNDRLVLSGLHYGERVTFDMDSVTVNAESKYYAKGIRESGLDNSTVGRLSFTVTKDQDYVVAYGVRGNTTAYTVHFVDWAGNELAPSVTYYGNVGDKPVVAFRFIDGYLPNFYNLTMTLSANAADNVFTFVYTRDTQGDQEEPTRPEPTPKPETEALPEPEPEPTPVSPEEIGDLDLPKGDYDGKDTEKPDGALSFPTGLLIVLVVSASLLFLTLILILLYLKRRKKEDR